MYDFLYCDLRIRVSWLYLQEVTDQYDKHNQVQSHICVDQFLKGDSFEGNSERNYEDLVLDNNAFYRAKEEVQSRLLLYYKGAPKRLVNVLRIEHLLLA